MENKKRKVSGLILTGASLAGMASTAATTTSAGFIDFFQNLKDGASSGIDMVKNSTSKGLGMLKTGVSKLKDIAAEHPVVSLALLGVTGICFAAGYFYKKLSNSASEEKNQTVVNSYGTNTGNGNEESQSSNGTTGFTSDNLISGSHKDSNSQPNINLKNSQENIEENKYNNSEGEIRENQNSDVSNNVNISNYKKDNEAVNKENKNEAQLKTDEIIDLLRRMKNEELKEEDKAKINETPILKLMGTNEFLCFVDEEDWPAVKDLLKKVTGGKEKLINKILKTDKNAASIIMQLFRYKNSGKKMKVLFEAKTGGNNEFVIDKILRTDKNAADIINNLFKEENSDELMKVLFDAKTGNNEFLIDKILQTDKNAANIIEQLFKYNKSDEKMGVLFDAKTGNNEFLIDKILAKNTNSVDRIILELFKLPLTSLKNFVKMLTNKISDNKFIIDKITDFDWCFLIFDLEHYDMDLICEKIEKLFSAKTGNDQFVIDKIKEMNNGTEIVRTFIQDLSKEQFEAVFSNSDYIELMLAIALCVNGKKDDSDDQNSIINSSKLSTLCDDDDDDDDENYLKDEYKTDLSAMIDKVDNIKTELSNLTNRPNEFSNKENKLTLKIDDKEYNFVENEFGEKIATDDAILLAFKNVGENDLERIKDRLNKLSAAYKAYKEQQLNKNK